MAKDMPATFSSRLTCPLGTGRQSKPICRNRLGSGCGPAGLAGAYLECCRGLCGDCPKKGRAAQY